MTWTRVQSTGSGALDFRLTVEGCPTQFVTSSSMEQTLADTRTRKVGLKRDGIRIEERVDIARATLDVAGIDFTIVDVAEAATNAFARQPTKTTYLTATASASATSLTVGSTSGFSNGDYIHLGTETIQIGTVASSTSLTGCSRAQWNSIAQKHYTGDGAQLRYPSVTDRPHGLIGRRVYLYIYGPGDSKTGDGTLIWRGIVARDARLENGTTWTLGVDHIVSLFDADLGSDLEDPSYPRGIYYPATCPLTVVMIETSGTSSISAPNITTAYMQVVGFFETPAAFITELNSKLSAGTSGFTQTRVRAKDLENGGWAFVLTTSATARFVRIFTNSAVDAPLGQGRDGWINSYVSSLSSSGTTVQTVAATTTYYVPVTAGYPRGCFGLNPQEISQPQFTLPASQATYPKSRIHIGGSSVFSYSPANGVALSVEWPDGTQTYDVSSLDTTNRHATCRTNPDNGGFRAYAAGGVGRAGQTQDLPKIRVGRHYSSTSMGARLDSFFYNLTADAPTYANLGIVPWVTTTDIDTTAASLAIARASRGRQHTERRKIDNFSPIALKDLIAEECKLLGIFPSLTADGKISFTEIQVPSDNGATAGSITTSKLLTPFPGWERNASALINSVVLRTGYNPSKNKHEGRSIVVRDVEAFSANKQPRLLEIKPYSTAAAGDNSITNQAVVDTASRVLAIFGGVHAMTQVDVPLSMWSVRSGQVVKLTAPNLPNHTAGGRGLTNFPCLVTGRQVDFASGRITLDLLLVLTLRAYFPATFYVSSQSGSSTTWTLTLSSTNGAGGPKYAADTVNADMLFAVNDRIKVWKWDATSIGAQVGTVTSVSGNTMGVTFDASWTPGSDSWLVGYAAASVSSLVSSQLSAAFVANTSYRIVPATLDPQRAWQLS